MKRLVLCEGKNDVRLVSSFLDSCDGTYEVWEFHAEDVKTSFQNQQREIIQNFHSPWNQKHALVKSENGKRNLEKVFTRRVGRLVEIDPAITVMGDLDGGTLDRLLEDYDERIQELHAGRGLSLGSHSIVDRNADMIAATCEVLTHTKTVKGTFDLLAFRHRPEDVVGVAEASAVTREELVDRLLAEDHVTDLLRTALLED